MKSARYALTVHDGAEKHRFAISESMRGGTGGVGAYAISRQGLAGRAFTVESRPWEPGDPVQRKRVPLFPWNGGLQNSRLNQPDQNGHSKANGDTSFDNQFLHPPKLNLLTLTNAVNPNCCENFDSKLFINGGRYMYYIDVSFNVVEDKDFGSGKACTYIKPFNNQLICAMGESEKIWARDPGNGPSGALWHQATDSTFAVMLEQVGDLLWRSESTNKLSNCSTSPLTLANWAPASAGNKYPVGDTTWPVTQITNYGGVPWPTNATGAFSPDGLTKFQNQTPNIQKLPHADTGKGTFAAKGFLFVPSAGGLGRIALGESKFKGPEQSARKDYRFWTRGGVEFSGDIYLLVTDESGVGNTAVIKMVADDRNISGKNDYLYYELARLPGTTKGYFIGVFTASTNPTLVVGYGNNAYYFPLGRNGGQVVDDPNYVYGTSASLETGDVSPAGGDLSVVSSVVGVQALCNYSRAGDSLSLAISCDGQAFVDLLDTQEQNGNAPIALTNNWESVTRYATPGTEAQFVNVRVTSALTATSSGTNRPELRELWLLSYLRPKTTDIITVGLTIGSRVRMASGNLSKLSAADAHSLWRLWQTTSKPLLIDIDGYEEEHPTRFLVVSVQMSDADTQLGPGGQPRSARHLEVQLARLDFAGDFAAL